MRTTLLVLSLLLGCGAAAAQEHAHSHATPSTVTAPAQRYATDAVLRMHMHEIRTAVDALDHYQHGHMGAEQARVLALRIQDHVRGIIDSCKLPPDADAALHAIIVPMLQNATALGEAPENLALIAPMQEALAAYAQQFDDPGVVADD